MDIFQLLTRSTKIAKKSSNQAGPSATFPSSGVSGSPQIYHDESQESRGKKRRHDDQNEFSDEEEVNFFATKSALPRPQEAVNSEAEEKKYQSLGEDECRKILQSHRIKVSLLKSEEPQNKKSKGSGRIKKSKLDNENKNQKIKQIYPQPLESFSDLRNSFGISKRMAENLASRGYKIPTEVQMVSLPLLLRPKIALEGVRDCAGKRGVDTLAIAPTGSGKTLAFLIPIVDQIVQRRRKSENKSDHRLEAVIMAPTKELADQITNEAKKLSIGTGIKVTGMRKGMRLVENTEEIENTSLKKHEDENDEEVEEGLPTNQTPPPPMTTVDILITTPGLLLSSLATKKTGTYLSLPTVHTLVLDEADILLDSLFRDQTLLLWSAMTSTSLQTMLWSATISSSIEALVISTLNKRLTRRPLIRIVIGLKDSALPSISQKLIFCATEPGKLLALRDLIHNTSSNSAKDMQALRPPLIIFAQTIARATALHAELLYDMPLQAGGSSRIAVLHSLLSDSIRSATLDRFRNGEIWVLITTDLLSRGVDFRGVNAVVNYDIPNDAAGYIHRIGRTGRCGREGGIAVTLYTREDIPFIRGVVNVIEASRKAAGNSGDNENDQGVSWLLKVLPKISKEDKKKIKLRGVEARRGDLSTKEKEGSQKIKKSSMRIGTRSGFERKISSRRKGAIEGSKRRANQNANNVENEHNSDDRVYESEWSGLND
ncbi:ATP dependent RNA helicase (Rok1) [Blumeria hordei DH14]|uniref:ATP-dependent RNA helicase n=1 Tax=Blumeria graminis f. sp. hordei (strain DH14) TaxID=546991 RepID=N1JLL6_BLUG1|nr:ATP dependent RNA helicase (Rok1) [Blumeria hordei DH14]